MVRVEFKRVPVAALIQNAIHAMDRRTDVLPLALGMLDSHGCQDDFCQDD